MEPCVSPPRPLRGAALFCPQSVRDLLSEDHLGLRRTALLEPPADEEEDDRDRRHERSEEAEVVARLHAGVDLAQLAREQVAGEDREQQDRRRR